MTAKLANGNGAGALLRHWRQRRRLSQLDLALEVGVSARHLSFVETGRAQPSPELLLGLAEYLHVPLREQNALLLAAGYAPRFSQTDLDEPVMTPVREALTRLINLHDPYPGVVIDHRWDLVMANTGACHLLDMLPPLLVTPPLNMFRACLHPDGFAAVTRNFSEWATYLLSQLDRLKRVTRDPVITDLAQEVSGYPNVAELGDWHSDARRFGSAALLVPWRIELGGAQLSLFSTLTTFASPRDVTIADLAVELFYPGDEQTGAVLHSWHAR